MFFLTDEIWFPPVHTASPEGILAVGGDLSVKRLLLAYQNGIFPWFNEEDPIVWYCPNTRMVLFPHKLKVSKSMQQLIKKDKFKVTFNTAFKEVVSNCKNINRKEAKGTWITDEMEKAYNNLHQQGYAKSIEVWLDGELAGGLYGVDLGKVFCGESMFSKESNASKIAFIYLVEKLRKENYAIIDCQVYTSHLERLGAEEIPREEFLKYLYI
jgi:leucyl/phenylalanyl-tRNA--protein transferase